MHTTIKNKIYELFLNNKYTRWYCDIIDKSFDRVPEGMTEKHHIVPSCLLNELKNFRIHPENCARLTPREHYIAHWLLTKMCKCKNQEKMMFAFTAMAMGNEHQIRTINSRTREKFAQFTRERNKNNKYGAGVEWTEARHSIHKARMSGNQYAKGHTNFGGRTHSLESKTKIRNKILGRKESLETRERKSKALTGLKRTEESIKRISESQKLRYEGEHGILLRKQHSEKMKGRPSHNKGKPMTDSQKEKLRIAASKRPKMACPSCARIITSINLSRHLDKCSRNKQDIILNKT